MMRDRLNNKRMSEETDSPFEANALYSIKLQHGKRTNNYLYDRILTAGTPA
jgi:hypothetical protein